MDWNRIIGTLLGGFTVKAAAIVAALILAHSVYVTISTALAPIAGVLK